MAVDTKCTNKVMQWTGVQGETIGPIEIPGQYHSEEGHEKRRSHLLLLLGGDQ